MTARRVSAPCVARYLEQESLARIVNAKVASELPPVGIILQGRIRTPATELAFACSRLSAPESMPRANKRSRRS